jgi:hypothetical protein
MADRLASALALGAAVGAPDRPPPATGCWINYLAIACLFSGYQLMQVLVFFVTFLW